MLNILVWSDAREKFRITVDTSVGNTIIVHVGEGETIKLVEVGSGFYLLHNPINITNKKLVTTRF